MKPAEQIKQLLNLKSFEGYEGLVEPIQKLIQERDELVRDEVCNPLFLRRALRRILSKHVELVQEPSNCNLIGNLTVLLDELITERNTLRQDLIAITNALTTEPSENEYLAADVLVTMIHALRMERNALRTTHNPRYIVHGHVQPCVVLYSDETTTLVRIDEGDMMCETDTIQWSDALTYRCQELLAAAGTERGSMAAQRVLPVLVELVRAEHVTLNDEGVAVEQPEFVAPVACDATSEVPRAYRVASAMPFDPYA
jgi:hypothetical protein